MLTTDTDWDLFELLYDDCPTAPPSALCDRMNPFAVDSNGVCMTSAEMPIKLYVFIMREAERVERFITLRRMLWWRLQDGPRALTSGLDDLLADLGL